MFLSYIFSFTMSIHIYIWNLNPPIFGYTDYKARNMFSFYHEIANQSLYGRICQSRILLPIISLDNSRQHSPSSWCIQIPDAQLVK
jgi:hypothetical protein